MRRIAPVCCTLFALAATAAAETSVEEVRKAISDAYKNMKSYSADFQMTQDMSFGEGSSMKSESSGKMLWKQDGGKVYFRTEVKSKTSQNFGGQKQTMESTTLSVSDGEYAYTLSDSAGQKYATKQKMKAEEDILNPASMFDSFKEFGEVKVLDEDAVEGQACYVIEATAKADEGDQGMAAPFVRQRVWFRKDNGLGVQMVGYDGDGKEVMKSITKNIKLNPSIDASKFKFEAPEGVTVMDMDAMPKPTGQEP